MRSDLSTSVILLTTLVSILYHGTSTSAQEVPAQDVRLTLFLERLELGPKSPGESPWMFDNDIDPYNEKNLGTSVYAGDVIRANLDGTGDGTCGSGGSGVISAGSILDPNTNLPYNNELDSARFSVSANGFVLDEFEHINIVNPLSPWTVFNQSGDTRIYRGGVLEIFDNADASAPPRIVYRADNISWFYNISYPQIAGPNPPGALGLTSLMTGDIDVNATSPEWLANFDPNSTGTFLARTFQARFSGEVCWSDADYWLYMDPVLIFEPNPNEGRIVSSPAVESAAQGLSTTATVVIGVGVGTAAAVAVGAAAGVASAGIAGGGGMVGPPGGGMAQAASAAATVAVFGQIKGANYSTGFQTFTEGMDPFILRTTVGFIDSSTKDEVGNEARRRMDQRILLRRNNVPQLGVTTRQFDLIGNDVVIISEGQLFSISFIAAMIVCGVAGLHILFLIITRFTSRSTRVFVNAWMVYLEMIAMTIVFPAITLSSVQYLNAHVGFGTGTTRAFVVCGIQLFFVSFLYTAFVIWLVMEVSGRVRRRDVRYVDQTQLADPKERNSLINKGAYQCDVDHGFHTVFACFYDGLTGTKIWLFMLEHIITTMQLVFIGILSEDSRMCLTLIIMTTGMFTCLVIFMCPMIDLVEQILATLVLLCEWTMAILAIVALGKDEATANDLNTGMIGCGWAGLFFSVLLAAWSDFTALVGMVVIFIRENVGCCKSGDTDSNASKDSGLSGISGLDEESQRSGKDLKNAGYLDETVSFSDKSL